MVETQDQIDVLTRLRHVTYGYGYSLPLGDEITMKRRWGWMQGAGLGWRVNCWDWVPKTC